MTQVIEVEAKDFSDEDLREAIRGRMELLDFIFDEEWAQALEGLLQAYKRGPNDLAEAFRTLYQDYTGKVLP